MGSPPAITSIPLVGTLTRNKATEIEKWAFVLLCVTLGFVLLFCGFGLCDLFWKVEPALPAISGNNINEVQAAVNAHRLIAEEMRAPLAQAYDLLITRTLLPIATLLLGFLFGKSRQ